MLKNSARGQSRPVSQSKFLRNPIKKPYLIRSTLREPCSGFRAGYFGSGVFQHNKPKADAIVFRRKRRMMSEKESYGGVGRKRASQLSVCSIQRLGLKDGLQCPQQVLATEGLVQEQIGAAEDAERFGQLW